MISVRRADRQKSPPKKIQPRLTGNVMTLPSDAYLTADDVVLRTLSLASGLGALELGAARSLPLRVVCYVERETYSAANLVSRMQKGELAPAPVWTDIETFQGQQWRYGVDLITAGYPCQGESYAGTRLGERDDRFVWPSIARIVETTACPLLFFENVPGHLAGSFERVLGDLHSLGFYAEWDCVPAAALGAVDVRDRLFILAADPNSNRVQAWLQAAEIPFRGPQGRDTAHALASGEIPPTWPRMGQPPLLGSDERDEDWVEQVRALGNTVDPRAAGAAFGELAKRMLRSIRHEFV